MTSNRLILIFLAFIFVIIVILSSSRISNALRTRFGGLVPPLKPTTEDITPTPIAETITSTPTPTTVYGQPTTKGGAKSIPATGPEELLWLVLGGSFLAGVTLKQIAANRG